MKRVLVLIHFTAKQEGQALIDAGTAALAAARANLREMAVFFNSNICFGIVGKTNQEVSDLHKALCKAISPKVGDNISVLELDLNIISNHPGLTEWQSTTVISADRERSKRQK